MERLSVLTGNSIFNKLIISTFHQVYIFHNSQQKVDLNQVSMDHEGTDQSDLIRVFEIFLGTDPVRLEV